MSTKLFFEKQKDGTTNIKNGERYIGFLTYSGQEIGWRVCFKDGLFVALDELAEISDWILSNAEGLGNKK